MTIPKDNAQLENARRLRREMTPHERKLWIEEAGDDEPGWINAEITADEETLNVRILDP